jgi:hypothetical protein
MAWIESHQALGAHPKTIRLAALLKVRVPEAVGLLHFLWWWALDYAPNGLVSVTDQPVVARACLWHGPTVRFWEALLEVGFMEPAELPNVCKIHDWDEYGGKLVESRQLRKDSNRRAQTRWRNRSRANGVSDYVSAESALNKQPTLPDTTVHNRTVPDTPPLPPHQVSAYDCCPLAGVTQGREHMERCPSRAVTS